MLTFTDADALLALQTIMQRRPQVVALERMFAVTPRGAALINRIKADPTLREAEIRVLAHNSDYTRVVPRQAPAKRAGARPARHPARAALQDGRQRRRAVVDGKIRDAHRSVDRRRAGGVARRR